MCTGCTYTNGLANNSSANPGTTWPGAFTTGLQTVFGDRRMCRPWHTHDTRTTGPLLTHNRPASTTRAASPRLRPAQYTAPAPCKFTTTAPHRDHFTTQDVLPKPGTFHAESRHHMEQLRQVLPVGWVAVVSSSRLYLCPGCMHMRSSPHQLVSRALRVPRFQRDVPAEFRSCWDSWASCRSLRVRPHAAGLGCHHGPTGCRAAAPRVA